MLGPALFVVKVVAAAWSAPARRGRRDTAGAAGPKRSYWCRSTTGVGRASHVVVAIRINRAVPDAAAVDVGESHAVDDAHRIRDRDRGEGIRGAAQADPVILGGPRVVPVVGSGGIFQVKLPGSCDMSGMVVVLFVTVTFGKIPCRQTMVGIIAGRRRGDGAVGYAWIGASGRRRRSASASPAVPDCWNWRGRRQRIHLVRGAGRWIGDDVEIGGRGSGVWVDGRFTGDVLGVFAFPGGSGRSGSG